MTPPPSVNFQVSLKRSGALGAPFAAVAAGCASPVPACAAAGRTLAIDMMNERVNPKATLIVERWLCRGGGGIEICSCPRKQEEFIGSAPCDNIGMRGDASGSSLTACL